MNIFLKCLLVLSLLLTPIDNVYANIYGFIKDGNTYTSFTYPGATSFEVLDINNYGQIVGSYEDAAFNIHGFIKDGSTYTPFDYPGSIRTTAFGINDAGKIVGVYQDSSLQFHGFIKDGNTFTPYDYPGASYTMLRGINDADQIVGVADGHGIIINNGTVSVYDYPGASGTSLCAINDAGQILGYWWGAINQTFVKDGASLVPVYYPGSAYTFGYGGGINNSGQVVGLYAYSGFPEHGFIKDGNTYTSFDYPGSVYTDAFGNNDAGQIVGTYLPTSPGPVPEPTSMLLLGLGLMGLAGVRRKFQK